MQLNFYDEEGSLLDLLAFLPTLLPGLNTEKFERGGGPIIPPALALLLDPPITGGGGNLCCKDEACPVTALYARYLFCTCVLLLSA